jgi:MFS family permease
MAVTPCPPSQGGSKQEHNRLPLFKTYLLRIRQFSPNARLFLLSTVMTGMALGVYRLLFNFYALSLDLNEGIIGQLITINSLVALLVALPMGYLGDTIGRKRALIAGWGTIALSVSWIVILPSEVNFYLMSVLMGAAQSLTGVTMAPFLLENSGEEERTYLFSLSQGSMMVAAFMGSSVGGYLPSWIAQARDVSATSSQAYGLALGWIALLVLLGMIPLFLLKTPRLSMEQRSMFAPIGYAIQNRGMISKLVLPMLVTSIGAGLFMPFMNIFFREQYSQADPVIGNVLAWGALAMGIGLFIAPPLADRIGKIQLVVITQALSIPFLILMGFSPWFWLSALSHYARLALMNMGGPIYNTFVMEHVEAKARALVASLTSMAFNFGWAFSPTISGWLQVHYGFAPVYVLVVVIYILAVYLYWRFFWPRGSDPKPTLAKVGK